MKKLIGGTLALMLASFAFAAPKKPSTDANKATQTAEAGAKSKGKRVKHTKDASAQDKTHAAKQDAAQAVK